MPSDDSIQEKALASVEVQQQADALGDHFTSVNRHLEHAKGEPTQQVFPGEESPAEPQTIESFPSESYGINLRPADTSLPLTFDSEPATGTDERNKRTEAQPTPDEWLSSHVPKPLEVHAEW